MFETVASYAGAAISLAIVFFALSLGDKPEKIGAATYLIGWLASIVFQTSSVLSGVQWKMFLIDLIALFIFASLVWKAPRSWPVWACAFQLLGVTSHVMVILHLKPTVSAFYTVVNLTGYGILTALLIGTFWAWQERKALDMTNFDDHNF